MKADQTPCCLIHFGVAVLLIISFSGVLSAADPVARGQAAGWGTLQGRIVFGGQSPSPEPLQITRDEEYCGDFALIDESLVISRETSGLRYVAIWLESREPVPVHPKTAAIAEKPVVLDNLNCRFEPRMLIVRPGQTLEIRNSDTIAHNAAVFARRNQPFSEVIPMNQPLLKKFPRPETQPIRVDCSIHAWMKAWMVVCEHPYAAVTDQDGKFTISDLPAGEWTFRFWHERPGNLSGLRQQNTPAALNKGVWKLKITADETTDLGDLSADAAQFLTGRK